MGLIEGMVDRRARLFSRRWFLVSRARRPLWTPPRLVARLALGALALAWLCAAMQAAGAASATSDVGRRLTLPPTSALPSAPTDGPTDPNELATFLDGVLGQQLSAYHIPGATVAVVKDGQLFFAKGYGSADVQNGTPVQADATLFRVGSVSKLFVWTAVMQLTEAGKLNLTTDINTYLKTYRIPDTYPGHPITLAHLLTHTAGFEDRGMGIFARDAASLQPLGAWLAANIPTRVRPPGQLTSYSNYGATLAAYIVEQVSGQPFEQYVADHVLTPLGMRHSSFHQPLPTALAGQVSAGYSFAGTSYTAQPFEYVQVWPAGSLSATATDMASFMIAQLQNGRFGDTRILQDATAREMHTQHFTNDPRVPGVDWGFYEQRIDDQRLIEHGGDTQWFHTLLALLPEHNVGLFVSYNSLGGATARDALLRAFVDRYYNGGEPPPPKQPLPGNAERAAKIAGSYWMTRHSDTTFEKVALLVQTITVTPIGNGRLAISLGVGAPAAEVVEMAPWQYRLAPGQDVGMEVGTIVFQTDSSGNVTTMLLGNVPIIAAQRVAWYQTSAFNLTLLVLALLVLLAALVAWPVRVVRGLVGSPAVRAQVSGAVTAMRAGILVRARGRPPRPAAVSAPAESMPRESTREDATPAGDSSDGAPAAVVAIAPTLARADRQARLGRLAHLFGWIVAALFALFTLGLVVGFGNPAIFEFGVTPVLIAVLTLGLLGALLTLGVVACAVLVWRERVWTRGARVFYALVALAALAFVWELAFWNLLGYRF